MLDEKIEYGKSEVKEKEHLLKEVVENTEVTAVDSLQQKVKIKKTDTYLKAETLREEKS